MSDSQDAALYSRKEALMFVCTATLGDTNFRCLSLFGGPTSNNVLSVTTYQQYQQKEYPGEVLIIDIASYRPHSSQALDEVSRAFASCNNIALVAETDGGKVLLLGEEREAITTQNQEAILVAYFKLLGKAVPSNAGAVFFGFDDDDDDELEEREEEEEEEAVPSNASAGFPGSESDDDDEPEEREEEDIDGRTAHKPKHKLTLTAAQRDWAIQLTKQGIFKKDVATKMLEKYGITISVSSIRRIRGMPKHPLGGRPKLNPAQCSEAIELVRRKGMNRPEVITYMRDKYNIKISARSISRIPGMAQLISQGRRRAPRICD